MIDRLNKHLSLTRQCQLLGLSRSSLYYQPATSLDSENVMDHEPQVIKPIDSAAPAEHQQCLPSRHRHAG